MAHGLTLPVFALFLPFWTYIPSARKFEHLVNISFLVPFVFPFIVLDVTLFGSIQAKTVVKRGTCVSKLLGEGIAISD